MGADRFTSWLESNREGLLSGLLVALVIVAVMLALREFGRRTVSRDPEGWGWRSVIGRVFARTSIAFMIVAAADIVATYAELPHKIARLIDVLFVIAFALQGAVWVRELVLGVIGHRVARDNGSSALASAMAIIRVLVSVALFAIAGILILDNLGVNVTALVAGLGIGGIAIGLAAQGIFSDLFAALSILFDKPFRRGDSIQWDKITGTVETIGLKSTRIRSVTGEEVVISNTNLLSKELHNMARLRRRRISLKIGLTYQTPPDVLAKIPAIVGELVGKIGKCTLVRCGMTGFGDSTLDFVIHVDVQSDSFDVAFDAQSRFCIALLERFNNEKIDFAYPTQVSIPGPSGFEPVPPAIATAEPTPPSQG